MNKEFVMALRDAGQAALFASCHKKRNTVALPVGDHGDGWTVAPESTEGFSRWCQRSGMIPPVAEYRFHPVRRWRFDYAWPSKFVALEVEGGIYVQGRHTRGAGFKNDMEKYNEAAAMGWRLLRFTPSELKTLATLELIKRTLS
jgi:hypothetical protein